MRQSLNEYKQNMYNFFSPTATFIAVCLILFALITKGYIKVGQISFLDIVIVSLASMRLIRLFCYDSIFKFIRHYIAYESRVVEENGEKFIESRPRKVGYFSMLACLLDCVWCVGMWTTIVAILLYVVNPFTALLVVILAIAGVASIFQLIANLIGAKYELADRELDRQDPKVR